MIDTIFSNHALEQIKRRGITEEIVLKVINEAGTFSEEDGKRIYQTIITFNDGAIHLVRVFVNVSVVPNIIITVYRTSKINKYYEG
jgi:hypothetical protein